MRYAALLFFLLGGLCHGCGGNEPDVDAIVVERAEERLRQFRANFRADCQGRVLEAAQKRADSLILDRARRLRVLAGRPPKPRRPGEPQPKQLSKELPLRPLFPFEIRFDTLLRDSLYQDSLRLDSLLRLDVPVDTLKVGTPQKVNELN